MKKITFLVLVMVIVSCGNSQKEDPTINGSFKGSGQGRNGQITANVDVKQGKIVDVQVVSSEETPEYALPAMEQIITTIVANNNKMLDLYSGVSKPYIELIQELYNTGEKKKVESYNKKFDYWCLALTHDQYNALGVTSTNPYIIYKSNADLCEALLNKIFDEKICMPSYHPSGYAFDLSTDTSTTSKVSALYNKNKQMVRERYIHFTLN